MERAAGKTLKKATTTQFEILVEEMTGNPDLARGVPVFGSNRETVDERWEEISRKLNCRGPPTRTAGEWKKIWSDLKCRTKKKIGDNMRSLTATGGGPFRHSPLSEMEQAIDSLVSISRSAAPSGRVLGIPPVATPNTSRRSSAEQMQPLVITPSVHSRSSPTTSLNSGDENQPPTTATSTTITRRTPRQVLSSANRKRAFHETVAESAKEQAEAAKDQSEAAKKMAEASMLQVDATNRLTAAIERLTEIFEKFLQCFRN